MLSKTRGIVLNYIKYRETSVIARIYTEEFGYQSFVINSIRSAKSKKGLALLQPLTLLDLVIYFKKDKHDSIHRISEYKCLEHFLSIPFNIKKSTMALFITELLVKVLKEEEHHGAAYSFIHDFVVALDRQESQFENMHLYLLIRLTHYLGFGLGADAESGFDLHHSDGDRKEIMDAISMIAREPAGHDVMISNAMRRDVLFYLVRYYASHVEGFNSMKSLEVLNQIFE